MATLIQKLFPPIKGGGKTNTIPRLSSETSKTLSLYQEKARTDGHITMLSNNDLDEELLDRLLGSADSDTGLDGERANNDVSVDITLRTQVAQPPLIMLLITVPESRTTRSAGPESRNASVDLEIRLNGRVKVTQVSGLGENTDRASTRLNRVLETSEDLGVLVEYVIGQLQGA